LVPDEQYAESQAHAQGMTFIWGGTGRSLASCYTQILPYSDVAYYQTEYLQFSDPTYAADVHSLIQNIRNAYPGMPVYAQVSVNPPGNTTPTAAEVEAEIDSLMDGSPGQPDQIDLFYSGTGVDPTRVQVAEQVIQHYRSR